MPWKLIAYAAAAYYLWGRKRAEVIIGETQMIAPPNPELPPLTPATGSGCGVFTPSWSCKP